MIQTKIATLLLVTAIAAPSLYGAEYRPKSRIPALVAQQPQAVGELRLEAGGNDKTLLLAPGTAPHIMKLPFDSKGVEKVESKTLLWRPEDGQDFMYAINPDAEPPAGPWLGVHVAEVSDLVASQLGLSPGMGLAIQHIVPESPAAKAGLRQHDILTKLDDQTLINSKQLVVLVRSKKSGEGVKLTFIRGGEEQSAKAVIADRSGKVEVSYKYNFTADDEDIVVEVGANPVVIDRKMAEKMHAIEKGALASAMAKGKASSLKQGMHTSLFFMDNVNLVLSDDTGTYNLRNIDGTKRLVVLSPEGDTLYKGDLETEKSIEELPDGIREKVKQMTGQNKTEHLMRFYKQADRGEHGDATTDEVHVEEEIVITPDIKH